MVPSIFPQAGQWYRGNLHGHTTESDGAMSPAEFAAFYRGQGYDFVAVTDHWKITDMGAFADRDFAVLPGTELDGRDEARDESHHVVGLGLDGVPPVEAARTLQGTVDAIRRRGGLAFVAHPYWCAQTADDLLAAEGYSGIEVWNTFCEVHYGKGRASVHWDELLQHGRLVTALATDDTHQRPGHGGGLGTGWVAVRAERLEAGAILAALAGGHFYASTGPQILELSVEPGGEGEGAGAVVTVRCSPCRTVHFICKNALGRSVQAPPLEELTQASQRVHRAARYVRVECIDGRGRTAWSMPVDLQRLRAGG